MRAAVFAWEGALLRPRHLVLTPGSPFRRHARSLVAAHQRCGHLTVVLCLAPDTLAGELWHELGADALLALDGAPEAAGLAPAMVRDYLGRRRISPESAYGYGSRLADIAWLAPLGCPIAVNAGSRLRRHAELRGWRAIDLDSPAPVLTPGS